MREALFWSRGGKHLNGRGILGRLDLPDSTCGNGMQANGPEDSNKDSITSPLQIRRHPTRPRSKNLTVKRLFQKKIKQPQTQVPETVADTSKDEVNAPDAQSRPCSQDDSPQGGSEVDDLMDIAPHQKVTRTCSVLCSLRLMQSGLNNRMCKRLSLDVCLIVSDA